MILNRYHGKEKLEKKKKKKRKRMDEEKRVGEHSVDEDALQRKGRERR